MKKRGIIISLIFIISIIFNLNYSCFAKDGDNIDTSILSNSFITNLNPEGMNGPAETLSTPFVNFIHRIVNPILGFVQIIGGILTIISIAIFGFGLFLNGNDKLAMDLGFGIVRRHKAGGPEAKMELLDFGRGIFIGSVLLFSGAAIVKIIFAVFNV